MEIRSFLESFPVRATEGEVLQYFGPTPIFGQDRDVSSFLEDLVEIGWNQGIIAYPNLLRLQIEYYSIINKCAHFQNFS